MTPEQARTVQELADRQAIYDCLMRYCRGVDRLDRKALETVYHPDALDDHGDYCGPASGFIDWAMNLHATCQDRTQHVIANHHCELDGDVAHCESYWTFHALNKPVTGMPRRTTATGRYIDRFEKRDGRWAIAARICVIDTGSPELDPEGRFDGLAFQQVARDRSDPSYHRPPLIDPARFTG